MPSQFQCLFSVTSVISFIHISDSTCSTKNSFTSTAAWCMVDFGLDNEFIFARKQPENFVYPKFTSSRCSILHNTTMTVHSFHIFDRKGKTLFTKRYVQSSGREDEEHLSEQRKLIFGMLFSIRELSSSLSPVDGPGDLQLVKTGASTLYNFETVSGLRFVVYTTPETSTSTGSAASGSAGAPSGSTASGGTSSGSPGSSSGMTNPLMTEKIRGALQHIYEHLWVTFVVRSPMYEPNNPDISSTNFEASLDSYLRTMNWFR